MVARVRVGPGKPAPLEPQLLGRLRAGGDFDGDHAVHGLHVHRRAERGFRQADGYAADDVEPLPPEGGMALNLHLQQEVPGRRPAGAGLSHCGQAQLLSVLDAAGDLHVHGDQLFSAAAAAAGRAGLLEDLAAAEALGAGPRDAEPPLCARHGAPSPALGAGLRLAARRGARAAAAAAGLLLRHAHLDRAATGRQLKGDADLAVNVPASLAGVELGSPARSTEDAAEQVANPAHFTEAAATPRGAAAGGALTEHVLESPTAPAHAGFFELIVLLALFLVSEDGMGLGDLLEPLLRRFASLVAVRVVLLGEAAEGLVYLLLGGVRRDAERLVIVFFRHGGAFSSLLLKLTPGAGSRHRRRGVAVPHPGSFIQSIS